MSASHLGWRGVWTVRLALAGVLTVSGVSGAAAAGTGAAATPADGARKAWPVAYHEEEAFSLQVPAGAVEARTRAAEASAALAAAIDAADAAPDAPTAEVVIKDDSAVVRVRGHTVTVVHHADARAAGFPGVTEYAQHLQARLERYVPAQLRRSHLQQGALHLFLSVFLGLMAVLAVRQVHRAFSRAERWLSGRRDQLEPLSLFRVPVMSGQALAGLLAFLLEVGRVTALMATVTLAAAAILGQFDVTRGHLTRATAFLLRALWGAVEEVGSGVPGLLAAAALLVVTHALWRVFNLLLDGVSSRRVQWQSVPPARVPVLRVAGTVAAVLLVAPVAASVAFAREDGPVERLLMWAAGVALLGALPLCANWAAGTVIQWRAAITPGEWLSVGSAHGEVAAVRLSEVVLVPEGGGTITVPMLTLLWHPLQRMPRAPHIHIQVRLARDRPVRAVLTSALAAARSADPAAQCDVVRLSQEQVELEVVVAGNRPSARHELWLAMADAVERGELALLPGADRPADPATR